MIEEETFFAWLDGELGPSEAAEMEVRVAADPELKRLADQHRALGSQLRSAFDPIADSPVPQTLQAALRPTAQVIDFGAAKRARSMPAVAQWTAMAATLAIGIFIGTRVPQESSAPVQAEAGKLYAAASINRAANGCAKAKRPRTFSRTIVRTIASPGDGARSIPATASFADPNGGTSACQDRGSAASFSATARVARASATRTSGQARRSNGTVVSGRSATCRLSHLARPPRHRAGRRAHGRVGLRRGRRFLADCEQPTTPARSLCRAAEA